MQSPQPTLDPDRKDDSVDSLYAKARPRSQSLGCGGDPGVFQIRDRLSHTVDFKMKGMKSNTRGHVIQQPLATLKDLFHKLPKTVGFNIELSKLFVPWALREVSQLGTNYARISKVS